MQHSCLQHSHHLRNATTSTGTGPGATPLSMLHVKASSIHAIHKHNVQHARGHSLPSTHLTGEPASTAQQAPAPGNVLVQQHAVHTGTPLQAAAAALAAAQQAATATRLAHTELQRDPPVPSHSCSPPTFRPPRVSHHHTPPHSAAHQAAAGTSAQGPAALHTHTLQRFQQLPVRTSMAELTRHDRAQPDTCCTRHAAPRIHLATRTTPPFASSAPQLRTLPGAAAPPPMQCNQPPASGSGSTLPWWRAHLAPPPFLRQSTAPLAAPSRQHAITPCFHAPLKPYADARTAIATELLPPHSRPTASQPGSSPG